MSDAASERVLTDPWGLGAESDGETSVIRKTARNKNDGIVADIFNSVLELQTYHVACAAAQLLYLHEHNLILIQKYALRSCKPYERRKVRRRAVIPLRSEINIDL